jgi:hypothetical protein
VVFSGPCGDFWRDSYNSIANRFFERADDLRRTSGQAATGPNVGQQAKDLVEALNSAVGYSVKWFEHGVCAVNWKRLTAIQKNMNLLAINKLTLANAADRYLVNDSTVTWDHFKTLIDGVERATQVTYDASQLSAQLFSDPSLGKPYRAFMVGLADRKDGLLPRMQMAAREVDQLTRTGGPVMHCVPRPSA